MRALNNLRKAVPFYFKEFVDLNRPKVEICQVVEFPGWFQVLTYDVAEECYYVGSIQKPDGEVENEFTLFEPGEMINEEIFADEDPSLLLECDITTVEQYANFVFGRSLGIEGL